MARNVFGSILALIGATAAVWSPFRAWYDGRHGSTYRIDELFSGISADKAAVAGSVLLPLAFAALVTLVGLLLRSRVLVAVAGLVVLGFTILWMVRQGQAAGSLTVDSSGKGLGQGVAMALGGGVLLLLAAALMSGRRRTVREPTGYGVPTTDAAQHRAPAEHRPERPAEESPAYGDSGYGGPAHDGPDSRGQNPAHQGAPYGNPQEPPAHGDPHEGTREFPRYGATDEEPPHGGPREDPAPGTRPGPYEGPPRGPYEGPHGPPPRN
ncbi:hypothetical protein ACIOUE_29555 [Streptomyces xanthochromogenes]|uniref:hypothetical protein n=1 Tax=Streptomyces xanthochromogenes TaxID=67384 RepID=UPI00381D4F79